MNDDTVRRLDELDGPEFPARLQCMVLPNGRFLLVLDGWTGPDMPSDEEDLKWLKAATGAAGMLTFNERVDVVDQGLLGFDPAAAADSAMTVLGVVEEFSGPDFDRAAAEACALTDPEDAELRVRLSGVFAEQAAKAEAWDLRGEQAVERADALRRLLVEVRAELWLLDSRSVDEVVGKIEAGLLGDTVESE